MSEYERKQMAFLAWMLLKPSSGQSLDLNGTQQMDNIASELGFNDLDENEFRY